MSAAQPHIRKTTTDTIVRNVGLASNNIYGFIKVEDPVNLEGMVLPKPKIAFAGNRLADLANPKSRFPTDFNRAGQYYDAKELTKWELVFVQNEEVQ